ncbi:SpoIIE family protein phosphatase [Bdellovibrio bacteriovorus]|nr:SpoIIE family protein phosphatase [Bdellovibrio bacteriovorus]
MKLNAQIKLLISFLLLVTVLANAGIFLYNQYHEKVDLLVDMVMQKNRFLERISQDVDSSHLIANLQRELSVPEWSRSMLVDEKGTILFQEQMSAKNEDQVLLRSGKLQQVLKSGVIEGLVEEEAKDGMAFVAYRVVPKLGFFLTVAPKRLVISSLQYQMAMAFLICVAFLALADIGVSYVLNRITNSLERLSQQVEQFGQDGVRIEALEQGGSEEISTLSKNFNKMTQSIEDLIAVKEKKSSMDAEIRMAEQVQMSFFPEMSVRTREYSLAGYTQQMHGCGGDWLYHFEVDHFLFIAVGDVTGHGLSSALLTGVSRTYFSVIEDVRIADPGELLEGLNRVLHKVAKGSLSMTFFLGRINLVTGEMDFANASHCAPFVFKNENGQNVGTESVMAEPGSILGLRPSSKYSTSKYFLKAQDTLFVCTDGLVELRTPTGRPLGERKLIKSLKELFAQNEFETLSPKLSSYVKQASGGQPCEDDISWMILRINQLRSV